MGGKEKRPARHATSGQAAYCASACCMNRSMDGSKSASRTSHRRSTRLTAARISARISSRCGSVHFQVLLDGLHDIVDEVAQERLLVHALGVLRHRVVERHFFVLEAETARSLVVGVPPSDICLLMTYSLHGIL